MRALSHSVVAAVADSAESAVHRSPPLYDQLQLAIYQIMHRVTLGDLLHVYRDSGIVADDAAPATAEAASTVASGGAAADAVSSELAVFPVELDGKLPHRQYIYSHVLPRARLFVKMLHALRADDTARWRLLLGTPSEQWAIVEQYCPYFRDAQLQHRPR